MAKGYITGTERFPQGPQPGTGLNDVQIVENIDLIFGDSEELKFGDGNDAIFSWDGTDLTLDVLVGSVVQTSTHGAISGEEHSLDIISTATLSSGDGLVGLNVAITPSGTAGSWASAIFGKVTEVAAAPGPVGGYFCGAEFEVNITGSQPTAYGVLVLNSNADNSTYGSFEGYIWLREYGSKAVRSLFNFMDHSRASESNAVIVSQTGSKPFDTAIRCTIGSAGTTGLWLMASSVGPADAEIDFKMLGSGATNYVEYDASEDQLNIVVASRTITGKDMALDINFAGTVGSGDYMIGCRSQTQPTGAAAEGGAVYAMAFQGILTMAGANRSATGYACGAEFRLVMTGTFDLPDHGVLVLAMDDDNTGSKAVVSPYIMLREYGDSAANAFVRFHDHTRASASDSVILSQVTDLGPFDTAVRCMVGTTAFWLYGSTTGPTTFEMAWSGAVRNKGLNFNDATFTAGSNYNLLSYGDYGNEVQLSVTDYCFPVRFNITSINNPGSTALLAYLYLNFKQSTENQANLQLQVIGIDAQISKNLSYAIGVSAFMDVTTTCSTGGIIGGKFVVDISASQTLTHSDNVSALYAGITGTGTTTGGAHHVACIELNKAGASTLLTAMLIQAQVGATITSAIKLVGVGEVTNLLDFTAGDGSFGAVTGAYSDAAQNSDGLIRILVAGTEYFIPYFGTGKVTGEW